ncbi:MAG TPA: periplasmic heavy metal sensor [Terriglobales bacterium]|nr:periplasmic heavy metal sensor [Terriglobales bacterium]
MKKTIGMVLAAVLSAGALTAVAADFAGHRHGRGMRGDMFGTRDMESKLNLTADQKAKLEQIHSRQREQMKTQFEQGRQEHQALMQELYKDNPNQAEIQRLMASIQQRQAAAFTQHIQAMQEFSQSLTSEQRAQMQQLLTERAQKHAEMRQKWEQRRQQKQQEQQTAPQTPQQ